MGSYIEMNDTLQITKDINKTTSGKFKIIYINTPDEMKIVHSVIDRNKDTYFDIDID